MDRFVELVTELQRRDVQFVLIGVWEASLWAFQGGQIFTTEDRDFFLPLDADNELSEVCDQLGFDLWIGNEPLDIPRDRVLAEKVVEQQVVIAGTAGDLSIDLSLTMAGFRFEDVWNERRMFRINGIEVPVARLTHIVESKRIANRPKDRLFLETYADVLRQLLDREKV
jgi:hypothetical protein